jgi:hypothetical protein
MNPDGRVAVEVEADGQPSHPLAEAPDVLSVADGLIQEPRRQRHGQDQDDQRVQQVHG